MANHTSDNEIGSAPTGHADDVLPSKGGNCARCGKLIAPIAGATSKHDEETVV
jgi:hypothetical protein